MASFHEACSTKDVQNGMTKMFKVSGKNVLIANDKGSFYALSPYCTHDGQDLDADEIVDHALTCPRHGAVFDVRDGSVIRMPAVYGLATYPVKVENDTVFIQIGD
ncbi:MAG: Rieske (2Fe-2S) protein [bacterium]